MQEFRRAAYFLAALSGAAFFASLVWRPTPPPPYQGLVAVRARVPERLAGYVSQGDNPISEPVRAALAAADLLSRVYKDAEGNIADVTLIGGTDRSALHDPRSCLVGAGWRIENDHVEAIPGTGGVPARMCRIVNGSDGQALEVVYLYVVNGKIINEVTQIRSQMLLSALIGKKNTPVCFVRFMHPISGGAGDARQRERFLELTRQMWNTLKVPESQTIQQTASEVLGNTRI